MFHVDPEKPRFNLQVLQGFLLGVVASLACLFLTIFLAGNFGSRRQWIYPAFNAAALILVGAVALRHVRESSYALGVVIAIALALFLDAAFAAAFVR